MNTLVAKLEQAKPYFNKISDNMYMSAVRNGFLIPMYVILFSSVFMMIAYIPNVWNFYWSNDILAIIMRPYNFTMGFFGFFVCMTITKSLTDEINKRKMSKDKRLDTIATMLAAAVSYFIMVGDTAMDAAGMPIAGAMRTSFMGANGIFVSLVIAFTVPNIYRFCYQHNVTIKLPDSVPPNISDSFKSLFAFSFSALFFLAFQIIFKDAFGVNLAAALSKWLAPLFTMGDSYAGVIIVAAAVSFFWFIGIHGPSIVMPALAPVMIANFAQNQEQFAQGLQVTSPFTSQLSTFVVCFGGTGATFVVAFMFAFLAKSKEHKAVGKAALFPTICGINEPILFGAPLILNPMFFVPFLLAPIVNAVLFKFFVSSLGMNGFAMNVPWTCPAPLAIPLGTGLAGLSFVLVALIIVLDFIIYYPFFKAFDMMKVQNELEKEQLMASEDKKEIVMEKKQVVSSGSNVDLSKTSVLVLCIGGGTSGMLANALRKAAKARDITLDVMAGAYGTHEDILPEYNLVILAPQAATYYDTLKGSTDSLGIKLVTTNGQQYIELSQNPDKAFAFMMEALR